MTPLIVLSGGDLAAILGAVFVLIGVLATAFFGFQSNKSTSAVAIAGTLAGRVTKLETDLAEATTTHTRELNEIREKHEHDLGEIREKHSTEIADIRGQLTLSQRAVIAAVRFIDRLVEWGKSGGTARMPTPPKDLHEYLDPEMWGESEPE